MIFFEIFKDGQLLQDDWSIAENSYFNSGFKDSINTYFNGFITRPIGALFLSLISILEYDFHKYFFINISIYFLYCLIIFKVIKNKYNKSIAVIIILLFLFPNFNSSNIFSPAAQSLGIIALFFWSISFYLNYFGNIEKNNIKKNLSWIFFIFSILTYEVCFVLIFFNLFFHNNEITRIINSVIKFKLSKFFKYKEIRIFLLVLIIIFSYQVLFTKLTPFTVSNRYRILNSDTLFYIIEYSHIPFSLIIDSILIFKNSFFISKNYFYILLIILIASFSFKFINLKELNVTKNKSNFYFIILFSYLLFLFFFVIASSIPTLEGYNNRAMGAYNFIFIIFVALLIINLKIPNNIKKIIFTFFIILNTNLFIFQINNNLISSKIRNDLLNKIVSKTNLENINKAYVFSLFPTYPNNNTFKQTIFSEESYDFNKALLFKSNRKLSGVRLYKKIECQKNFSSQIQLDKIIFFNPSRTKRSDQLEKNQITKKHNEKFIIYDYYNDRLIIFKDDIKELNLNKLINCN